jgi:hypothetical protein
MTLKDAEKELQKQIRVIRSNRFKQLPSFDRLLETETAATLASLIGKAKGGDVKAIQTLERVR